MTIVRWCPYGHPELDTAVTRLRFAHRDEHYPGLVAELVDASTSAVYSCTVDHAELGRAVTDLRATVRATT